MSQTSTWRLLLHLRPLSAIRRTREGDAPRAALRAPARGGITSGQRRSAAGRPARSHTSLEIHGEGRITAPPSPRAAGGATRVRGLRGRGAPQTWGHAPGAKSKGNRALFSRGRCSQRGGGLGQRGPTSQRACPRSSDPRPHLSGDNSGPSGPCRPKSPPHRTDGEANRGPDRQEPPPASPEPSSTSLASPKSRRVPPTSFFHHTWPLPTNHSQPTHDHPTWPATTTTPTTVTPTTSTYTAVNASPLDPTTTTTTYPKRPPLPLPRPPSPTTPTTTTTAIVIANIANATPARTSRPPRQPPSPPNLTTTETTKCRHQHQHQRGAHTKPTTPPVPTHTRTRIGRCGNRPWWSACRLQRHVRVEEGTTRHGHLGELAACRTALAQRNEHVGCCLTGGDRSKVTHALLTAVATATRRHTTSS